MLNTQLPLPLWGWIYDNMVTMKQFYFHWPTTKTLNVHLCIVSIYTQIIIVKLYLEAAQTGKTEVQ